MASYVMLFHYTHQGVEHVKQSPDRVDALKKIFNKHGAKIKDFYALLGQYDTLFIVDAPNDETVAKLPCTSLSRATRGSRRTARSPRQNFASCCRRSTNHGCEQRSACRVEIVYVCGARPINLTSLPPPNGLRHPLRRVPERASETVGRRLSVVLRSPVTAAIQ